MVYNILFNKLHSRQKCCSSYRRGNINWTQKCLIRIPEKPFLNALPSLISICKCVIGNFLRRHINNNSCLLLFLIQLLVYHIFRYFKIWNSYCTVNNLRAYLCTHFSAPNFLLRFVVNLYTTVFF